MILTTDVTRQRSIVKRKGPAGAVGGSSYTTPSVYVYSNFPECRLHI